MTVLVLHLNSSIYFVFLALELIEVTNFTILDLVGSVWE